MDLVLDIASSAEFWRQHYPANRTPRAPEVCVPRECASRKQDVMMLLPDWIDESFINPTGGVLHVLDIGGQQGRQTKSLVVHKWNGAIPEGSFYKLEESVYVQSPGFMFLNAASVLDFPGLVAFGDELCGLYSFDAREERGFKKRIHSLTSKEKLEKYLLLANGLRGQMLAMRALQHVVDNSASPMETFDEMTMCLPYRYGGYGIVQPEMNMSVTLTKKAAQIAKRRKCFLDMGYSDFNLDIEHHGKYDHSSAEDIASDRARVNALREMGIEVIELSAEQVNDLFAYEYIIERVARITGKRLPKNALGATSKRIALRNSIREWNMSSGKIR